MPTRKSSTGGDSVTSTGDKMETAGSSNAQRGPCDVISSSQESFNTPTRTVPLVTVTDETGTRTITTSGQCLSVDSADLKSADKRKWFQSKWFSATTTKDRREKFKRRTVSLETEQSTKEAGRDKRSKGRVGFLTRQGTTDTDPGTVSVTPGPSTIDGQSRRSRRPISRLSSVWSEVVSNSVVGGTEDGEYSDISEEDVQEPTETRAAARWRIIRDRIGEVIFFGDRDLDYEYEPHPNSMAVIGPDHQRLARDAYISSHLFNQGTRRLSGPFPITAKGRRHQVFMTRSLDRSREAQSQNNEGAVRLDLGAMGGSVRRPRGTGGSLRVPTGAEPDSSGVGSSRRNRKMSLSCLANSILSLEKGRRRASRLRDQEMLQAAENGDVQSLRMIFLQEKDMNINCTDMLGRTPLQLAVANEHQEVVNFLLDYVDTKSAYEALLLAIKLGHDEIAEMILEHPKYEEINNEFRKHSDEPFFQERFCDHSQFTDEITPLILAAQNNRYEVVMALLMKGHVIEKPHKYNCICIQCHEKAKKDELKFAKSRLNAYKGMASEAYISLSSEDPILTSFELRHELHQVATAEKYYTAEYNDLAGKLADYVVKLLDKVQGNEELNVLLNNSEGLEHTSNKTLARLQLAIDYKEKKFVAHPSCQKKLTSMWYDNCEWLKNRSWGLRTLIIISIALTYPMLATVYMIVPKSKLGTFIRTPCIKFVAETASFLTFLALIVVNSFEERGRLCDSSLANDTHFKDIWDTVGPNVTAKYSGLEPLCIRNYRPEAIQMTICIWITALLWQEIKQIFYDGFIAHFSSVYNHMDLFMLIFYFASVSLHFLQYLKTYWSVKYFKEKTAWFSLLQGDNKALYMAYWLVPDRFYWDSWDPINMSEAMHSVANVLTFSRLFYLLAINEHLGPMLISLERMIQDVFKFMVTFMLIFVAFMVGLHNLYWYYHPDIRGLVEFEDHKVEIRAEKGFGSWELSFRTILWALFGLSESRVVELGEGYSINLTERVGYIVFGVYNWASVIILLNMLIAMMTRSFEKITREQDVEWKFARSQLYMEYIKEGSTLPVPFNIVPSPKSIIRMFRGICSAVMNAICRCRQQNYLDDAEDIKRMNGILGGNIGRHYIGECDSRSNVNEEETMFVPLKEAERNYFADQLDTKAVIKKVVRRYIFEHLQASVNSEGDMDNVRQAIQTVQDDVKNKQKDLDFITSQQTQVLDTVNSLKESINELGNMISHLMEPESPSKGSSDAPRVRRRQVGMHPLSESIDES